MNYLANYDDLITSRKKLNRQYFRNCHYELHHILPRSLGGTDDEGNLVLLTHREHFLAHYMLHKIYGKNMTKAFALMCKAPYNKDSIFCSRMYEKVREEYLNCIRKKVVCLETGIVYNSRTEASVAVGKSIKTGEDIFRAIKIGDDRLCGGYHWAEYDEKIDYTKNKWFGKKSESCFLLIRLEDLKKYSSWKECADDLKCTVGGISSAIRTHGSIKGYHIEKFDPLKEYQKLDKKTVERKKRESKEVVCLETAQVFKTNKEAGRFCGSKYGVMRNPSQEINFSGGLHWEYYNKNKNYYDKKNNPYYGCRKRTNKILCIETKEVFDNLNEVRKRKGLFVQNALLGHSKTCGGLHWEYVYEDIKC